MVENMETWSKLTHLRHCGPRQISATAELPVDSPWFRGHFPGEPILPGVAQIALVVETLRRGLQQELAVTGVKRTRFKQVILPGDQVQINLELKDDGASAVLFRILNRAELVSSGTVTTEIKNYQGL
jgi:3-hydroxymyristoyl/3-hydroxydecanoyl-(acyl carrier protein) dehydratase